jgi:hypothetical protein
MHDLHRSDPHCGAFCRALTQTLLLAAALVFTGCTDSPAFVKPCALFVAAEKAPPSKALVYFYWPREEEGRWDHLSVSSCAGAFESVLPGGLRGSRSIRGGSVSRPNGSGVWIRSPLLEARSWEAWIWMSSQARPSSYASRKKAAPSPAWLCV